MDAEILYMIKAFFVGGAILIVVFGIIAVVAFMFYAAGESTSPLINKLGNVIAYILLVLFLVMAAIGAGDKWLNMK